MLWSNLEGERAETCEMMLLYPTDLLSVSSCTS